MGGDQGRPAGLGPVDCEPAKHRQAGQGKPGECGAHGQQMGTNSQGRMGRSVVRSQGGDVRARSRHDGVHAHMVNRHVVDGYYVAYKPITLSCFLFMFIEINLFIAILV